jgi:hypothetical protein
MTKIKDLVTVTVDNVFRNFPIDSERYELIDYIGLMLEESSDDVFPIHVPMIEQWRTKSFLDATFETFALGAVSLLRVQLSVDSSDVPSVVLDRARRFAASLSSWDAGYDPELDSRENIELWVHCIFSELYRRLRSEHTVHGVH